MLCKKKYGLIDIDGDKDIENINDQIQSKISEFLNQNKKNSIII